MVQGLNEAESLRNHTTGLRPQTLSSPSYIRYRGKHGGGSTGTERQGVLILRWPYLSSEHRAITSSFIHRETRIELNVSWVGVYPSCISVDA